MRCTSLTHPSVVGLRTKTTTGCHACNAPLFFFILPRPPTSTLFPYTTLFRSLIVVAIAFAAPFILGLFPSVRLPSPVLEIVAGIIVGPSVLNWAQNDETVAVMATLGLAFLL